MTGMYSLICKGCGRLTDSANSNYWSSKVWYGPTECYTAFENEKSVMGCSKIVIDYYLKQTNFSLFALTLNKKGRE